MESTLDAIKQQREISKSLDPKRIRAGIGQIIESSCSSASHPVRNRRSHTAIRRASVHAQ
jgi:hypothetical protein